MLKSMWLVQWKCWKGCGLFSSLPPPPPPPHLPPPCFHPWCTVKRWCISVWPVERDLCGDQLHSVGGHTMASHGRNSAPQWICSITIMQVWAEPSVLSVSFVCFCTCVFAMISVFAFVCFCTCVFAMIIFCLFCFSVLVCLPWSVCLLLFVSVFVCLPLSVCFCLFLYLCVCHDQIFFLFFYTCVFAVISLFAFVCFYTCVFAMISLFVLVCLCTCVFAMISLFAFLFCFFVSVLVCLPWSGFYVKFYLQFLLQINSFWILYVYLIYFLTA